MSHFGRCPKCGDYGDLHFHKCPPFFEVQRIDENPANAEWETRVYAHDEEEAAEKWAEDDDNNSAEYSIAQGTPEKVRVRRLGETAFRVFEVSGEYIPSYSASEIEESSEDQESRES